MFRNVANKNGTIEVNGNTFKFSQPIEDYKTEDTIEIENSYRKKLEFIDDDPHYITASNIELKNGQIVFEYNLNDIKMFDYLRTLFLNEKLYYYRSLIEIAKRDRNNDVKPLWVKENFVLDPYDKSIKTLIIEHEQFELQEKVDSVTALKDLIIISLTTMNRVLGKPRRADFLEQTDNVIHFAEKVYLKARTIEEVEEYVNAEIYELEMQQKKEATEQNQKSKLTLLIDRFTGKLSNSKSTKKESLNPELIDKLQTNGITKQTKRKLSKKEKDARFIIGSVAIIMIAIALNVVLNNLNDDSASANNDNTSQERSEIIENNESQEKKIIEMYRNSFFEEDTEIIKRLEEIGYENLENEKDKAVLEYLYIKSGNYEQALKYNSSSANKVAEYLYENEDASTLNDFISTLETEKTPEIMFYQALANEDWEIASNQMDKLELDEKKINLLLTAFFRLENIDGANELLTKIKPTKEIKTRIVLATEIINSIEKKNKEINNLNDNLDNADKKQEKKIKKSINNKKEEIKELKNKLKSI